MRTYTAGLRFPSSQVPVDSEGGTVFRLLRPKVTYILAAIFGRSLIFLLQSLLTGIVEH
jgi:hypothetical protein